MKLALLVLIGLPGSGKTTFARRLMQVPDKDCGSKFIHICYDELINFSNDSNEAKWKLSRNSVAFKVENLIIAAKNKNIDTCPIEFKNAFESLINDVLNLILIIDDNMYFRSMRYALFQIAKRQNIGFGQVYLKCNLESAMLNNSSRNPASIVPSSVIEKMYAKLEPPNCKNQWEKFSLTFESYFHIVNIVDALSSLITDILNNCFYEVNNDDLKELSRIQCKKNVLHQCDISLRKLIGFRVKNFRENFTKNEIKSYVSNLNEKKVAVLNDVKCGNISFPEEVLQEINSEEADKLQLTMYLDTYL